MYRVEYSKEALEDIALHKKSNPKAYNKILKFIKELYEHPRMGTGHPEALKGYDGNTYSRKINDKDRLIYEIHDDEVFVFVVSAKDHYNDK